MGIKDQLVAIGKQHFVKSMWNAGSRFVLEHKGTFLTGATITCNAAGIAVTYRNSPKIHEIISQYHRNVSCLDKSVVDYEKYKSEYLKAALIEVTPLVLPIIFFFAGSTAAAIVNQKQNEAKIATLTAALSMAQSTISEYNLFKEEAKKELGEEKFNEIQKTVTEKRVEELPVDASQGIKVNIGDVLCYIPDFNIFFSSTRERINFAMDRVNGVLASNGRDGRSYGHGTKYGNEIVTYTDILLELNDPQIEPPALADEIFWDAGKVNYITWNTYDGGVTRTGIPYMILSIDLSGSNVYDN